MVDSDSTCDGINGSRGWYRWQQVVVMVVLRSVGARWLATVKTGGDISL